MASVAPYSLEQGLGKMHDPFLPCRSQNCGSFQEQGTLIYPFFCPVLVQNFHYPFLSGTLGGGPPRTYVSTVSPKKVPKFLKTLNPIDVSLPRRCKICYICPLYVPNNVFYIAPRSPLKGPCSLLSLALPWSPKV